jgi:SAM-dependent methyltransferase
MKNQSFLVRILEKEQFQPGILGLFVNPFYFARKGLYTHIKDLSSYIHGIVLDIGCGQKPYEDLFLVSRYIGLEIQNQKENRHTKADYFYDGYTFPFKDSEFNSILTNQVFEHVFNPSDFLGEINRVLELDGTLLITVPFIWDEHEQPNDFARYSSFGLKFLLEKAGFEILEHRKSVCDVRVVFQLIAAYIHKIAFSNIFYINIFLSILLISPINILGEIFNILLPQNLDLYLDNIIVARKVRQV